MGKIKAGHVSTGYIALVFCLLLSNPLWAADETLGERGAVAVTVVSSSGGPICQSYAFSQVPHSPTLFVGKIKEATAAGICAGNVTLALFSMDWSKHVMTLLHTLMQTPLTIGPATIETAYDPYVAEFENEVWVAFECAGPHIPGVSSCIAPLVGNGERIDISRLTIPIVGLDSDGTSPWGYSASTPKFLNFRGHLYLYWTAIQSDKTPPHHWNNIETRGAEMVVDPMGVHGMWVKGRIGRPLPSHAPGGNISVMAPVKGDPYQDISVDTEGFLVVGDHFIVLSSVGGAGPDSSAPCTKPLDKSTGCFRLEITESSRPLSEGSFRDQILVSPKLPANAVEYPRIVTDSQGNTFVLAQVHPVQVAAAPNSGKTISVGLFLIPFHVQSLQFTGKGTH